MGRPLYQVSYWAPPGSPDLSTTLNQPSRSALVNFIEFVSFRPQLKTFLRLFTGISVTDGIRFSPSLKQNLSVTLPLFRTKDRDFAGLKLICAHDMSFSNPWRIHLAPDTDVVVSVRSSMKALIDGCLTLDLLIKHFVHHCQNQVIVEYQ